MFQMRPKNILTERKQVAYNGKKNVNQQEIKTTGWYQFLIQDTNAGKQWVRATHSSTCSVWFGVQAAF